MPRSSVRRVTAPRPHVLLATFGLLPDGEPGGDLVGALAEVGCEAAWASWDDPGVDWGAADLVVVRSTWDYHRRLPAFLAWARATEQVTRVLNGAEVFAWNADKRYLLDLADDVPIVPTALLDDQTLVPGLERALERWGAIVVKPRTGAGGVGLVVARSADDYSLAGLTTGPWVVQPLVDSVRTTGETSVVVLGGRAVSQVDKHPAEGEVRVHEWHGGRSRPAPLVPEQARVAECAVRAAAERLGAELTYARVDLMVWEGGWAVSELELIEPGLYLDVDPANAARLARAVRAAVPAS